MRLRSAVTLALTLAPTLARTLAPTLTLALALAPTLAPTLALAPALLLPLAPVRHTPRWVRVLLVADAVMRLRRRLPSLAYRAGFGSLLMLQVSVATLMAAPHHRRRDPAPPPSSDKTAVSVWTQDCR